MVEQLDGASLSHGGKEGDVVDLLGLFPAEVKAVRAYN
jgi:hypothetical protein